MDRKALFQLVAGLGNPGKNYENTRHNVGFLVVDELARREAVSFSHHAKWNADLAHSGEVTLMKPMTFMNLSGESVGGYARFFKIPPTEILVIIDDAALPVGRLRLRRSGSSGGHNGMESVMMHLGTDAVARLRIGIGTSSSTLHGHVLGTFAPEEREPIRGAISRAGDAIEFARTHGIEAAMNQFN